MLEKLGFVFQLSHLKFVRPLFTSYYCTLPDLRSQSLKPKTEKFLGFMFFLAQTVNHKKSCDFSRSWKFLFLILKSKKLGLMF